MRELIDACFAGIWIESQEHEDAIGELGRLCAEEDWQLAVWDVDRGLHSPNGGDLGIEAADPLAAVVRPKRWDDAVGVEELSSVLQHQQCRQWAAADKMRIVLAGIEAGTEISELCRVEGINPTQYYSWKKQLISGADAVFGKRRSDKDASATLDPHEQDMNRMRAVIAEITAENLELKKTF